MTLLRFLVRLPRTTGVASALAATGLGLAYLSAAGAPARYLGVNVAALLLGMAGFAIVGRSASHRTRPALLLACGLALVATARFGVSVEGATRWIALGPVSVQPGLILLPMMAVAFAGARGAPATAGIVLAAVAVAIQPDRAAAAMLVAALAVLVALVRERWVLVAFAASVAGLAATLLRPDTLPAVPFVDGVYYSAFDVGLFAGLAVTVGAIVLLAPAVAGLATRESQAHAAAFGATWAAAIGAAALGNYPTPVVGYGASAIIGYLLSVAMLPPAPATAAGTG